jgi:hypothetical protein
MSRGRGCLLLLLALALLYLQTMNGFHRMSGFYRSTSFRARVSLLARKVHTSREPSHVNPLSKSAKSNTKSIKTIKSNIRSSPTASTSIGVRSVKSSYPARAGIKKETNLGMPKPHPAQAPLSQSEEEFVCAMRDCRQVGVGVWVE